VKDKALNQVYRAKFGRVCKVSSQTPV